MKIVPAGILCYLTVSSPDFLKPLYHNLFGNLVMSILLVVYAFTCHLIDKITAIEI